MVNLMGWLGEVKDRLSAKNTCLAAIPFLLSACTSAPVVTVERINVPTYIPIPTTLTAPVKVTLQPGITWGEAVGSLYSGLQSCNADKAVIGSLKPPNTL